MSLNPGFYQLPRRQGRDLVTFYGFLIFLIFFSRHQNIFSKNFIYKPNHIIRKAHFCAPLDGQHPRPRCPSSRFLSHFWYFGCAGLSSEAGTARRYPVVRIRDFKVFTRKTRAGTTGSRAIRIILTIEKSFSDHMIRFAQKFLWSAAFG